jgi:hypothetical protein
MIPISRQRGQVLILLFGFMFFGGASSTALLYLHGHSPDDLKKAVKSVVTDQSRSKAALADIDQWEKALAAQLKSLGKSREEFVKLARRHDATRVQADEISTTVDESIREMDSGMLDARFRLKEQLTGAEWDAMMARLNE